MVTIFVDIPEHIARQRLLANREKRTRLDVTDADFVEILQATEPPTPDEHALSFRYSEQIDSCITNNVELLR